MKYKRVLLKVSGEALSGKTPIDFEKATETALQIKALHDAGCLLGVVVGGGNIWRGRSGVDELGVLTPDLDTPIRKLSGGNVQKILVGRELSFNPSLLMAAYVVRGLDINTSYAIYGLLNDLKKKGGAVIFVGEDLDVLLELCDRILVLCGGRVSGIVDERKTQKNEVGLLMTNLGSADSSAE